MDIVKSDNNKKHLLQALNALSSNHLQASETSLYQDFIAHAVQEHLDIDYLQRPLEMVFWNLYGLFKLLHQPSKETWLDGSYRGQIRIFNPDRAIDGWNGGHTVIYVNRLDRPFLVDSLRIALNAESPTIYNLRSIPLWVQRDDDGGVLTALSATDDLEGAQRESLITIEIECRQAAEMAQLQDLLERVMRDVDAVVDDFERMRADLQVVIEDLAEHTPASAERDENVAFLQWMWDGAFVFLGSVEYTLTICNGKDALREEPASRNGLFAIWDEDPKETLLSELSDGARHLYNSEHTLTFSRSARCLHIHRSNYAHYVVVKRFDSDGRVVGEARFFGLYSSKFYGASTDFIPVLRTKVKGLLEDSGFVEGSHDHKTLKSIAESYPRDELLQMPRASLMENLIGIWQISQRNTLRVFAHRDLFNEFVSFQIFMPRESFSTEVRKKIQRAFEKYVGANESSFVNFFLPESMLVRIYVLLPIANNEPVKIDMETVEALVARITASWRDEFVSAANRNLGAPTGAALARRFSRAFCAAYQEQYTPIEALDDAARIEALATTDDLGADLRPISIQGTQQLQLKLYRRRHSVALSDMIPLLENLGVRVLMERPYEISHIAEGAIWMQDFLLEPTVSLDVDVNRVVPNFRHALLAIWAGHAESDRFNRLVIAAELDWRRIALLRTYARYLKQLGLPYSQDFIADTLVDQSAICVRLMTWFAAMFDPDAKVRADETEVEQMQTEIVECLDTVTDVNQDTVLRAYLALIAATQRCNFYQGSEHADALPYLSLKICTDQLSFAPRPRPAIEIFVYSPRFEGVHLRGGKVARGGLRWSDRLEDYRTEILGLMKAQKVKNALIVPTGAKGGFVAKNVALRHDRVAWQREGMACYKLYIQALLDITDNLEEESVISPARVDRRDGDDAYLVVAADKGTATFSDLANEISEKNKFWLGDAFASGGSQGYDHKAMGITARGAWVAVQRHFRELGVDIQTQDFKVVGIGDMSGDVFGNGMLLSRHIQLVGAFNHLHIFIDPQPNAQRTFEERQRLFSTAGSTWDDFDRSLLSSGARIYSRASKTVQLSAEIKDLLALDVEHMKPDELIGALLTASVDLLWNGGVGTYVKASTESHSDVGDRVNDSVRVNANALRCRVVGEGGNLGVTQLGRIEFSLCGGFCNTDFIDNAAGVNCSDHEVNIKILLNASLRAGEITAPDRNDLLASMTEAVAEKVLHKNARQTQAISLALRRSDQRHAEYQRFMVWLNELGNLDRQLEFLPSDDVLAERLARKQVVWTRPELAVLVCYSKVMLKEALIETELLKDVWLADAVEKAFPRALIEYFGGSVRTHPLAREIAATELSNDLVDRFGFSFFYHQMETTGASAGSVIRAMTVVVNVLGIDELWQSIETDSAHLTTTEQQDLLHILITLVRRSTRWFLRVRETELNVSSGIENFAKPMHHLLQYWDGLRPSRWASNVSHAGTEQNHFTGALSALKMLSDNMFLSLGMIHLSMRLDLPVDAVADLHTAVSEQLSLDDLMRQIDGLAPQSRWEELARDTFVDQLEEYRRELTGVFLLRAETDSKQDFQAWTDSNPPNLHRWLTFMREQRSSGGADFAVISLSLGELVRLLHALQAQSRPSLKPPMT